MPNLTVRSIEKGDHSELCTSKLLNEGVIQSWRSIFYSHQFAVFLRPLWNGLSKPPLDYSERTKWERPYLYKIKHAALRFKGGEVNLSPWLFCISRSHLVLERFLKRCQLMYTSHWGNTSLLLINGIASEFVYALIRVEHVIALC